MLDVRWRHKDQSKRRAAGPTTRLRIPEDQLLWEQQIWHKLLIIIMSVYTEWRKGAWHWRLPVKQRVSSEFCATLYIYIYYVLFYGVPMSRTIRVGLIGEINREWSVRHFEGYDRGLIKVSASRHWGTRRKHVNHNQHSKCPGRVSNRGSPEYRSVAQFCGGVAVVLNCSP